MTTVGLTQRSTNNWWEEQATRWTISSAATSTASATTVVLTQHQWGGHILVDHPEIEGLLRTFQAVLNNPRPVTRDADFFMTRCFYRDGFVPRQYVKIVVDYPADDPARPLFAPVVGTIVTAFLATLIKPEEQQIWP